MILRKQLLIAILIWSMVFLAGTLYGRASLIPAVDGISPGHGRAMQKAVISGSGFKTGARVQISVAFGVSRSVAAKNIFIASDSAVEFDIPDTPLSDRDPRDASNVPLRVTVTVNGQAFVFDDLSFRYENQSNPSIAGLL